MKKQLLVAILAALAVCASAQELADTAHEQKMFICTPEVMPQFPGGDAALMKYIATHLQYPDESCGYGRVIVQFKVTKTGKVGEVRVMRSLSADHDKEAIRVVRSLPDFIPGSLNGEPINVWYTIPVIFKPQ